MLSCTLSAPLLFYALFFSSTLSAFFYALLLLSKCSSSILCFPLLLLHSKCFFLLFYALLLLLFKCSSSILCSFLLLLSKCSSMLSSFLCFTSNLYSTSPLFSAILCSSVLTVGRNWTRVSITGSSLSSTMPSHHRALLAFGDVLGALLSLHSRCRTVKFSASKVEIIHLTAPTPGAFAALGFDPQLSQTAAQCFISLSYLPIPSTVLQKPYSDCWSLSLKEMTIRFLKE